MSLAAPRGEGGLLHTYVCVRQDTADYASPLEPPHLAATASRPSAPRINPRQLKSGRATSELMEPEFRYRPTQSILTKIDVRKKYEFPGSYDPILGLGAPETFDHPNISYHDTRCRSKLEELEIAAASNRMEEAPLAENVSDKGEADDDAPPEKSAAPEPDELLPKGVQRS